MQNDAARFPVNIDYACTRDLAQAIHCVENFTAAVDGKIEKEQD
jgi:hypothetical protein